MSLSMTVKEMPFCTTVTFNKGKETISLDIFTQQYMDDDSIWMYILGEIDIPSYDVYKEYKERECIFLYRNKEELSRKLLKFFGRDLIREKMDRLDW